MTTQLTKNTIGVGVAGTGFIGPAHIEALRRNGIRVLGLAENTKEKAEQKAAELGIPRIYGLLEEMLADPEINVVHLATPNHLHHPHAKAALLAGKHVVCEKPMATSLAGADRMVAASEASDRILTIFQNRRYDPHFKKVQELIASGVLGRIVQIRITASNFGRRWD